MPKKFNQMKSFAKIGFSILLGFAVISFWRGVWGLMDLYLFPNNLAFSFLISILIGLLILILTNSLTKNLI